MNNKTIFISVAAFIGAIFIAAVAAFIVLKLFGWVGSLSTQILLFFGTYAVVIFVVDTAMKRYGETKKEV